MPKDVREDYGLYGRSHEEKFYAPADTKPGRAKQLFSEWRAEIEARIAAIRAQQKGEGISLTHRQARALAGEWDDWFIARHPFTKREKWEQLRDDIHEAMCEAISGGTTKTSGKPFVRFSRMLERPRSSSR